MGLIDLILNLGGLLLWLNWRSHRLDPLTRTAPATLAGTLKRADVRRFGGWQIPAGLVLLLCLRVPLYGMLGPPLHWTPKLNLGEIVPSFSIHVPGQILVFSVLSFLRVMLIAYFWFFALVALNRSVTESDPMLRILRMHLGRPGRWPWWLQLLLLPLGGAALWAACHPLLAHLGVINPALSPAHLAEQGLLIGFGLIFTLKLLLPVILLLHVVASYVYLGANPFWEFIAVTSRNLLKPLQPFPLRFAKVDFAPLAGVLLLSLLLNFPEIVKWAANALGHRSLTLWPL